MNQSQYWLTSHGRLHNISSFNLTHWETGTWPKLLECYGFTTYRLDITHPKVILIVGLSSFYNHFNPTYIRPAILRHYTLGHH